MIEETKKPCPPRQHVHEIQGSVKIAGCCEYAHNHRFATVSGEAVPCDGSHVHEVSFQTDSCNGHTHHFCGTTSPAIDVGCGKHVHLLKGCTSTDAHHTHEFITATFIEDPVCQPVD